MGWYAVAEAIKNGHGPYGTVKDALKGEADPRRSLYVAIREIDPQTLDRAGRARRAYWMRQSGTIC